MWRIFALSVSNVYKQIMVQRIQDCMDGRIHCGPTYRIIQTFGKYTLLAYLHTSFESGELRTFKKEIRRIVKEPVSKKTKWKRIIK